LITEGILKFFLNFITWVANLLPSFKLSLSVVEGQTALWTTINNVNCLVPVGTVLTILGLVFALYGAEVIWGIINWLIKKIPTIS